MTRVTITLEAPLAEALRAEARRDDRAVSSVARRAFARYFTAKARDEAAGAEAGIESAKDAEAASGQAAPAPPRRARQPQARQGRKGGAL